MSIKNIKKLPQVIFLNGKAYRHFRIAQAKRFSIYTQREENVTFNLYRVLKDGTWRNATFEDSIKAHRLAREQYSNYSSIINS